MSTFDQPVVLITGAGRGVGRSVAQALGARQARLALCDITPVNLDVTLADIQAAGGQASDYICDVGKLMAVQTMIDQVLADWERIDILINCSAVRPRAALLGMDEWDLRRTLEVNVVGAFFLLQQVGRVMREAGGGTIINLVADEMLPETLPEPQTAPAESAFAASMAGLQALSRQADQELRPYGIQVHAVHSQEIGWAETQPVNQPVVDRILSLCSRAGGGEPGRAQPLGDAPAANPYS